MSQTAISHPFDSDFRITPEQKEQFSRDGFIKLEGFLNADVLAMLRDRNAAELERGSNVNLRALSFSRVQYYFDALQEKVFELMERPYFRQALTDLTGLDLFLTFEVAFELEKNANKGLPWHVGVQSFGFQFAEEFGCTVWAPMHPIDANGQGGGLACVSQQVLPGEYVYSADLAIVEMLLARERAGTKTSLQDYFDLKFAILNNPVMLEMLECHRTEHSFEPGDVLVFNKMVPHRSIMLGEGDLDRRGAYVMRLVDANSRYDLNRAKILEFPAEHYTKGLFKYKPASRHHIELAEAGAQHGDLIAECEYFSDRDRRMIRAPATAGSTAVS